LHSADGRLHLVDPGGRPLVPPVDVGKPLGWASPLVDADNNTWICRSEGGLAKVDAAGQTAHRAYYRSRHRLDCTGLIHQNTLFLGCENHYLAAISLDAPSGRNAWADSLQLGRTGCPINCPLAVSTQQEILVVSQDNTLYAFGLDGQQRWTFALDGHVLGSPVVDADDIVYIAINKNPLNQPATGALIAVHSRTRSLVWRVETEIPIESTPVVGDDGMIYFGDNQGTIHAVDNRGQIAWTAEFDVPIRSGGTIPADQQLVFTQDDGTLVALRCSSKRLNPGPWPKLLGTVQQTGQTAR
jgi:outer membrane protein assembly factor BamB